MAPYLAALFSTTARQAQLSNTLIVQHTPHSTCIRALRCCSNVKEYQILIMLHVAGLQDDLLYESLTVYETLYYAAMLRLPQHMDHAAKTERVETVITALGLSSCKDTIIGTSFIHAATYIKAC